MTVEYTIPDLLDKAADVIIERGWHQGDYQKPGGEAVCAMGALFAAAARSPRTAGLNTADPRSAAAVAATCLKRHLGIESSLPAWNDSPGRTEDEVLAALRECAAGMRAGAR